MSAEQELREALRYYDVTPADEEWSVILAAVGRLLDPIPDETMETAAEAVRNRLAGDGRKPAQWEIDAATVAMEAYRAWLIGGEQ